VSAPAKTSGTGVALVVIGAAMTLLFTFVSYGWYSASYAGGGADQGWVFSFGAWAWTGLWPPNELFSGATSWPVMVWLQQITWIAAMITTLLCVAAAVLALLRAAGARVGGGVIRAFGIAAAIATVAYMVVWATSGDYRWLAVTDLAALVGAVLIIIGGGLLGSAAAPYPSSGAPLPARGPGDTH
jgi:ABC-type sugar transport system permease subunit